jgi:uncharacterized Zn finger protein (UPF0148 family)
MTYDSASALREKRKAAGLCPVCGAPVTDGHVTCPSCRRFTAAKERARREERAAAGQCAKCGAPLLPGDTKLCRRCREKQKRASIKYNLQRRAERRGMGKAPGRDQK